MGVAIAWSRSKYGTDQTVKRRLNQRSLAYVYSRANEAEAMQAKVLTEDEARRVAVNIARLPDLLGHKE